MTTNLNKYLKLQTALVNEKTKLEARLAEISKVLGGAVSVAASAPTSTGGKRKFSEATKAKMRAAQKARWAKIKGKAGSDAAPAPTPAKKRKKTKMSAAGRAAIVAAQKARWAKINAAKAKAEK